jgi:hypothetical protein
MNPTPKPLNYLIRIRGHIPACWIEAFADLHIDNELDACGAVTRLRGVFDDSAALQGVLNNLYMLGLPLISVEALDECQCADQDSKYQFQK